MTVVQVDVLRSPYENCGYLCESFTKLEAAPTPCLATGFGCVPHTDPTAHEHCSLPGVSPPGPDGGIPGR